MTHPLRVVLADDEITSRKRLSRMLLDRGDVSIAAECAGGHDAVEAIRRHRPDLVLLDVQMPDLDGFGVIDAIGPDRMPPVIFVTAYDQYALRAFAVHAADYLLKPYDEERLNEAIDRVAARVGGAGDATGAGAAADQLRALLAELMANRGESAVPNPSWLARIAVKEDGRVRFVRVADVDYLESKDNYVLVHTPGAVYRVRATLGALESQLDPSQFVRIHRRYVISLDRILEVQPWFAGDSIVILRNGVKLRLSRTHRESFNARVTGGRERVLVD